MDTMLGASEDVIKKVKRQPKEWQKMSANHISYEGLVSRICRELLQLNNKCKQPY